MKILIGLEDSIFSYNAARFVAQRPWRSGTQVRLISAVETDDMLGRAELEESSVYKQAREAIDRAVAILRDGGGEFEITSLPTDLSHAPSEDVELGALGEALESLAKIEPRLAECVDLKFFCGLSYSEIAELWSVSERTVRREWDKARIALNRLLDSRPSD